MLHTRRSMTGSGTRDGDSVPRGRALEPREMPEEPHLIPRLFRRLAREGAIATCYEAGVSGYDLHRPITACGMVRRVIAC